MRNTLFQLFSLLASTDTPVFDSSAIYCIECFNPVSEGVARCPHCGVEFDLSEEKDEK